LSQNGIHIVPFSIVYFQAQFDFSLPCVCRAIDRESFDVVVLRFSLGALRTQDVEAAVTHACRVLRAGGQLIVLDHVQGVDCPDAERTMPSA
jgi:hypothetical protein